MQSVAPQSHQATGFPPTPSSPSTSGPSQDASQTAPTPAIESRRLTLISIILAAVFSIIFGVPAWISLRGSPDKKALALQVWSALNDQRMSCWTDRDHGVFSQTCNDTLADPIPAPPVKRAEELQERSPELQEQSLFNFWCSYTTVLVVLMVLILIGSYTSQGRAPRRHDGSVTTWGDYYHRIETRLPFSRPTWLPAIPRVTSMSVYVSVGMGFMILDFVDPYTRIMIILAIATILVYWCLTDNFIATRRWSSEKASRAAV